MIDQFGSDLTRIIQDLARRVEKLEASHRSGPGLDISSASGAFFLPNSSTPATPAGGVAMYAAGGQIRIIQSDGTVVQIPAAHVTNQDPLETDVSAPGSYSSSWGQKVRNDLVSTRAKVFELQSVWRSAHLQASS